MVLCVHFLPKIYHFFVIFKKTYLSTPFTPKTKKQQRTFLLFIFYKMSALDCSESYLSTETDLCLKGLYNIYIPVILFFLSYLSAPKCVGVRFKKAVFIFLCFNQHSAIHGPKCNDCFRVMLRKKHIFFSVLTHKDSSNKMIAFYVFVSCN